MADETGVTCNYCGGPAELVTGEKLYPRAPEVHQHRYYFCAPCIAWVGTHEGTLIPQGTLANPELRSWRGKAFREFDPLCKAKAQGSPKAPKLEPHVARSLASEWLAARLGIPLAECHLALFDADRCRQVIAICEPYRRKIEETEREIAQRQLEQAAA
jgi:hypothetical protein